MSAYPDLAVSLALYGQVLTVPKDATIFEPGDHADGVYIVRSGVVHISLLDEHQRPVWSRPATECSILGLPAAVRNHEHCVRAVAGENSEMVFVPAEAIRQLLQEKPLIGTQILTIISEELGDIRRKAAMLNGSPHRPLPE